VILGFSYPVHLFLDPVNPVESYNTVQEEQDIQDEVEEMYRISQRI